MRKGEMVSISDKEFFLKHQGWSPRVAKGVMSIFASRRPVDEEVVGSFPLLSQEELRKRVFGVVPDETGGTTAEETMAAMLKRRGSSEAAKVKEAAAAKSMTGGAKLKKNRGSFICGHCRKTGIKFRACARCRTTYYCSRECQKANWKHHKVWCSKTHAELHDTLVASGGLVQAEDGTWVRILNPRLHSDAAGGGGKGGSKEQGGSE